MAPVYNSLPCRWNICFWFLCQLNWMFFVYHWIKLDHYSVEWSFLCFDNCFAAKQKMYKKTCLSWYTCTSSVYTNCVSVWVNACDPYECACCTSLWLFEPWRPWELCLLFKVLHYRYHYYYIHSDVPVQLQSLNLKFDVFCLAVQGADDARPEWGLSPAEEWSGEPICTLSLYMK